MSLYFMFSREGIKTMEHTTIPFAKKNGGRSIVIFGFVLLEVTWVICLGPFGTLRYMRAGSL